MWDADNELAHTASHVDFYIGHLKHQKLVGCEREENSPYYLASELHLLKDHPSMDLKVNTK